jgi:hypothetical protein
MAAPFPFGLPAPTASLAANPRRILAASMSCCGPAAGTRVKGVVETSFQGVNHAIGSWRGANAGHGRPLHHPKRSPIALAAMQMNWMSVLAGKDEVGCAAELQ